MRLLFAVSKSSTFHIVKKSITREKEYLVQDRLKMSFYTNNVICMKACDDKEK